MNNRNLRTNESFASGFDLEDAYEELVLNESKKPSKDSIHYHEHKICLDTVKNPNKARFMGGVGYKEAVETLKNKFGYTDEEIGKLSGEEINEASDTPRDLVIRVGSQKIAIRKQIAKYINTQDVDVEMFDNYAMSIIKVKTDDIALLRKMREYIKSNFSERDVITHWDYIEEEINESQVSGFRFIYKDKDGNRQTEIFWNDKQDLNWIRAEREFFKKYPDAEIIGKTIAYKGENEKKNDFIPVKTPADLKYNVELTGSHFFERPTMKFFGDRMSNYGVRFLKDENVYELYRRNSVKQGLNSSAYFDADTFERKHNIGNK